MALTRATDKIIANADGNLNLSGIVTASSFSGPLVPSGDLNVGSNIKLGTASGIVTATSFSGDGSNLTSLPAGLGTALSSTQTSPLNKLYYTNEILSIGATVTVDHPATGTGAYTQYADIRLDEGADLIIEDGDDVIPDILGLGTDGGGLGAGGSGRIRVDSITNKNANGAPNFTNGVTGTAATFTNSSTIAGIVTLTSGGVDTVGVVTATSFKGDGSQLSNITSTTINNNADNRVITGSGTANTLEGEANLTFDGAELDLNNSGGSARLYLISGNSADSSIYFGAQDDGATGGIRYDHSDDSLRFMGYNNSERIRINSNGSISFDAGITAAVAPSQTTASQIGDDTLTGGTDWFDHTGTSDYYGIDGDHKLTNGATYGKIVARNASAATGSTAAAAGHTWYLISKTVAGTMGQSNWRVETVAGWKMAWPTNLAAGATTTFYMKDAVESYGSPTIPATGDYYISWYFSASQGRGTNGGSYYTDASSGGNIYWYNNNGDSSNPNQRIPRQGDAWTGNATGDQMHVQYHTLPRADLSGTIFTSPLLVDPVIQGTPLMDGFPMSGGQLVKDVQWHTNTSSIEFMNADFVNCNYLLFYNLSGGTGNSSSNSWYETRMQFCDQEGSFYNNTNDYVSHSEWCVSTSTDPDTNSSSNERSGYARSIWLTGNGSNYNHMGWVWIIPSNFRHNRDATISQVWGDSTSDASTLPHVMVRGHSFLTAGTNGTSYREEGGGIYRGTNNIFALSGFRIFGAASSNPHTPSANGSGNGYVRIYRFRSGLETRE